MVKKENTRSIKDINKLASKPACRIIDIIISIYSFFGKSIYKRNFHYIIFRRACFSTKYIYTTLGR